MLTHCYASVYSNSSRTPWYFAYMYIFKAIKEERRSDFSILIVTRDIRSLEELRRCACRRITFEYLRDWSCSDTWCRHLKEAMWWWKKTGRSWAQGTQRGWEQNPAGRRRQRAELKNYTPQTHPEGVTATNAQWMDEFETGTTCSGDLRIRLCRRHYALPAKQRL